MGYLNFDEPFLSLVHQGTILGPDGNKMSKSKGNVVSPDESIAKYGADIFRVYLMFGFNYVEGGPWNDNGLDSVGRFFDRIERIVKKCYEVNFAKTPLGKAEKELNRVRHNTIKCVTTDLGNFSFNTAIARLMEFVNAIYAYESGFDKNVLAEFFSTVRTGYYDGDEKTAAITFRNDLMAGYVPVHGGSRTQSIPMLEKALYDFSRKRCSFGLLD
jgi:leucyl-tRNA synthetase